MLYFSKIRQDYTFYGEKELFDEAEYASHASFSQEVKAGDSHQVETSLLIDGPFNQVSGDYELLLVSDGVVIKQFPVYLAFTHIPESPDYKVSIKTASQTSFKEIETYFSYRQREHVKRNHDGSIDRTHLFNPSRKQTVASHSFAGISTDDYPIKVKVKVLSHAFEPNTYFDRTSLRQMAAVSA